MAIPAQKLLKSKFVTILVSSDWHGPSKTKINHEILLIQLHAIVNSDKTCCHGHEKL